MPDEGFFPERGSRDSIVLVEVNGSFWMLHGEEHLNAMLTNMNPYPKPVHFIRFETEFDARLYLPDGTSLMDLWGINPAIIERMRNAKELVEIEPKDS
ncbi:MAG: hypothetical protein AAF557_18880 [Pseudomonadota bacterium]